MAFIHMPLPLKKPLMTAHLNITPESDQSSWFAQDWEVSQDARLSEQTRMSQSL